MTRYKRAKGCADCGMRNPVCLEFDHVSGDKISAVATMVSNKASWRKIKTEIRKCDVRCSNCHRIRHHSLALEASGPSKPD